MGIRAHKSFAIQLDSVKTVGLCPICSMRTGTVCLSCSPVIPSPSSARRTVGTQRSLLDEGVDECSAWRDGGTENEAVLLNESLTEPWETAFEFCETRMNGPAI